LSEMPDYGERPAEENERRLETASCRNPPPNNYAIQMLERSLPPQQQQQQHQRYDLHRRWPLTDLPEVLGCGFSVRMRGDDVSSSVRARVGCVLDFGLGAVRVQLWTWVGRFRAASTNFELKTHAVYTHAVYSQTNTHSRTLSRAHTHAHRHTQSAHTEDRHAFSIRENQPPIPNLENSVKSATQVRNDLAPYKTTRRHTTHTTLYAQKKTSCVHP